MTTTHVPAPDEDLDQHAYDVCARCELPIIQHWEQRDVWVTMTGGNAECYGGRA